MQEAYMENQKTWRKIWIKDIVNIVDSGIYIPKNYKEMIEKKEKYETVFSDDSQCERLLQQYFGGKENAIFCTMAIKMGDSGCSWLDPVENLEEAKKYIEDIKDAVYFGSWTNSELKKMFPDIPVKLHPSEVEKMYGIAE
jgi:hypothetical protein